MESLTQGGDEEGEDIFRPYRDRIVYSLALATLLIFSPFAVSNLLEERWALGATSLGIVLVLVIDAVAIYRGRAPPIPLWVLIFPALASFVATLLTPLYIGLAWAYPMLVLFYFILPQRSANVIAALLVVAIAALSWFLLPVEYRMRVTSRLFATMALTAVLSNIFLTIISDLQRQLRRQTIVDPLTGAYNRRHMDAVLADAHGRAGRGAAAPSLLAIDIDHFKRINDQFGHAAGDAVLCGATDVVRRHCRATDRLFRSGGEEFLLFLPETDAAGARVVAEEVRRSVEAAALLEAHAVTVSIGVSTLQPAGTVDGWLRAADDALYRAKAAGRNCVCETAVPAAVAVAA